MDQSIEIIIKQCEDKLKQAMIESDVFILEELLAPNLLFTNHLGLLMSKEADIDAHKSGKLSINNIILTDQKITTYVNVAVVSVQAYIEGSFAGVESKSNFRFTRVWRKTSSQIWQVIVGHSSLVT